MGKATGGLVQQRGITNKGFSGNSSILPRSYFCASGQESNPQSLTAATLSRWQQL